MEELPRIMNSDEGFELRFPYKPLHWVTGLDADYEFEVDGLQGLIRAEKPFLVVKLRSFSAEQEALDFIPRIWDALARLAVERGSGFVADMTTDNVTYAADPDKAAENLSKSFGVPNTGPVHGIVNGNLPSVIPLGKTIRTLKAGELTATVTSSAEMYAPAFVSALSQSKGGAIYNDERLHTAIDLLCDIQREVSLRSKFLTCVIALEVLSTRLRKHAVVQELLDELDVKVKRKIKDYDSKSDEYHALESLQRELLYRREASLRSSIRRLVLDGLSDLPDNELQARIKDVVWAYDIRGSLVHDGVVPENDLHNANRIAYEVLTDLLKRRLGIT